MINSVTVTNHLGESTTLELRSPEKSGFFVRGISGLEPPKATINSTDISTSDGAYYNSARLGKRNIVFDLGFLENPTIEHTRLNSYKYFPIKRPIVIHVETDERICDTYGYVESNEANIFSRNQGCIVSVLCMNPYFSSSEKFVTTFSGVDSTFVFPFSNESLTEKLIDFGSIRDNSQQTVVYSGDVPTGVFISMHAIGSATNITITNSRSRQVMSIDTTKLAAIVGSGITNGDDIFISTVKGNKYIYFQREGEIFNILNALDKNAGWFQLETGDNLFSYTADTGLTNLQFQMEHYLLYEGV